MSITAVPISMRLVRAPIAASSGNGEASWRAKWWTRTNAPSSPISSAASASSIVCTCASRAVRVRDPGASCQWPNERNPMRFTPATVPGARREPTRTGEGPGGGRGLRRSGGDGRGYEDVVPLVAGGAAPAGGPVSVPVTVNVFETFTWTSPPDVVVTWTSYEPSGSCITRSTVPAYFAVAAALAFAAAVPVAGVPKPPPFAPAGGPDCVPVTVKSLETLTWTSPPDVRVTWTRYEPSESCSTRSTVPGYLAVAAALALSAAAPVTVFPMPGGTPWGLDEVAAAGVADAVLGVLLEAPQPARRPPTAMAATAPASVLRWRRRILGWVDDMPGGSARTA